MRFEAASLLAEMIIKQCDEGVVAAGAALPTTNDAKQILHKALEGSQASAYWHCRLLFQLANIHASEKDYNMAVSFLGAGVDFAYMAGASYARMFFLLSKAMVITAESFPPFLSKLMPFYDCSCSCFYWNGSLPRPTPFCTKLDL